MENYFFKDSTNRILLDKNDIISAEEYFDKQHNKYNILISLNSSGKLKVINFTNELIGEQIDIYLGEFLISTISIMAQINSPSIIISGDYSKEVVENLCIKINKDF